MAVRVILGDQDAQFSTGPRDRQSFRHVVDQLNAAAFVPRMAGQLFFCGRGLAEIVHQSRKPDGDIVAELRGLLEYH